MKIEKEIKVVRCIETDEKDHAKCSRECENILWRGHNLKDFVSASCDFYNVDLVGKN